MKKKTDRTVVVRTIELTATETKRASRRPFKIIGDATTKDGTRYALGYHRAEHFPVLVHIERDLMVELSWDFLVTIIHSSNFAKQLTSK